MLRSLSRAAVRSQRLSLAAPLARTFASDASIFSKWMKTEPVKFSAETPFETLAVSYPQEDVVHLKLNRPKQLNAMNLQMWVELGQAFAAIDDDTSIKAVIVSGEGRAFSSGMDLNVFIAMQKAMAEVSCEGRSREMVMRIIDEFQRVVSAPENCRVPVIAAVHGPCIGAGVDFISACDLRFCETSAVFSVKEIDLAIVADVGTLQRFPNLVGEQNAKELAYTGRDFSGLEAERMGFVVKCLQDPEELFAHVEGVAKTIAKKSPLTIRGIKHTIQYQRDHTTRDALEQVRYHNAAMVQSEDLTAAIKAIMTKTAPVFRKD
jgi:enoyl-CoA hydratase